MRAGSRALGPVEGFCGGLLAQGSETRPNIIALTPSFSRLSLAPWEAAPKGCSAPAGFRSTEVWARSAMASCGPLPPGAGQGDSRGGRTPPPPSLRLRPGLKPVRSQRLGYEGSQLVLPKSSSVPLLSPAWTPRGKGRGRTSVLRGGCLFFPPQLGAEVQSQQSSCPELSRGQKSSGGGVASGQALREVAIKRARGKSATEVPRGKAGRGSPREGRRQERLDGACLSPTPREGGALPPGPLLPSCPLHPPGHRESCLRGPWLTSTATYLPLTPRAWAFGFASDQAASALRVEAGGRAGSRQRENLNCTVVAEAQALL